MTSLAARLENAVVALCPDIWQRIAVNLNIRKTEEQLFEHLTLCLLSSQVSYDMAWHTNNMLVENGLLSKFEDNYELSHYEMKLRRALSTPVTVKGRSRRYRFPNIRAHQIARMREVVDTDRFSLHDLVYKQEDPIFIRETLVGQFSGIGLKQSSMFLRNIGRTYDLAIIDSHAMDFIQAMKLFKPYKNNFGVKDYMDCEKKLIQYADELGYPVGCVDWAIWIVMRVAKQESYI